MFITHPPNWRLRSHWNFFMWVLCFSLLYEYLRSSLYIQIWKLYATQKECNNVGRQALFPCLWLLPDPPKNRSFRCHTMKTTCLLSFSSLNIFCWPSSFAVYSTICTWGYRARILKHLLEAEKSTFRNELSFQRSESTTGLLQATIFVKWFKRLFYIKF
jgi:hypothetical protein